MNLSVHEFVSALPIEQQGEHTYSREAMLEFLRSQFHVDVRIKGKMIDAARRRAKGERIFVDHDPEDREAATAIIYAIARMADKLKPKYSPKNHFKVSRQKPQPRPAAEFKRTKVMFGDREEFIERYPADVTWEQAARFQHNPDYEVGEFWLEPEIAVTGETAHFDANERATGWGSVYSDEGYIGRFRCW